MSEWVGSLLWFLLGMATGPLLVLVLYSAFVTGGERGDDPDEHEGGA